MRKYVPHIAIVLFIALVVVFVTLRLLSIRGDLASAPTIERPRLLILAFVVLAAVPLSYALLWREIVNRLDKLQTPVLDAVCLFCASWLGRYIPSSLPYLAGKMVLGMRLGHSKPALAASVLYENVLLVAVGAVTSSVLIPLTLAPAGGGALIYVSAGLGGAAALSLLFPPVLHRFVNVATRLTRRQPVARDKLLSYRGILAGSALAGVGLALNGTGFALLLASFVDLNGREVVASAAVFNLAGVVGFLVIPIPSGLGVREAALIGLLHLYVPLEVAAAAAILARLCGIIGDVSLGLAGASLFALRQPHLPAARSRLRQHQHDTP